MKIDHIKTPDGRMLNVSTARAGQHFGYVGVVKARNGRIIHETQTYPFTAAARDAAIRWAEARHGSRRGAERHGPNPTLAVLGPNRARVFGTHVHLVKYEHVTEGFRAHEFGPGVRMEALPDGSVRLFHPRKRLWLEDR